MPYTTISDTSLIKKIKSENDEDSLKELINRHSPLCVSIFSRYGSILQNTGYYAQDLYKETDYLIYQSALKFDSAKKCKFSSYLGNNIRFYCLSLINSGDYFNHETLDKVMDQQDENLVHLCNDPTLKELVLNSLKKLSDKRIVKIYKLKYFSDQKHTWKKIGELLNLSGEWTRQLHDSAIGFLKKDLLQNPDFSV